MVHALAGTVWIWQVKIGNVLLRCTSFEGRNTNTSSLLLQPGPSVKHGMLGSNHQLTSNHPPAPRGTIISHTQLQSSKMHLQHAAIKESARCLQQIQATFMMKHTGSTALSHWKHPEKYHCSDFLLEYCARCSHSSPQIELSLLCYMALLVLHINNHHCWHKTWLRSVLVSSNST